MMIIITNWTFWETELLADTNTWMYNTNNVIIYLF